MYLLQILCTSNIHTVVGGGEFCMEIDASNPFMNKMVSDSGANVVFVVNRSLRYFPRVCFSDQQ